MLAKDYLRAVRLRGIIAGEIEEVMSRFDAFVASTRPTTATPLDQEFRSAIGDHVSDPMGAIGNGANF